MKEAWVPIFGYEGRYEVSNTGKVKTLSYNKTGEARLMKLTVSNGGYHVVTFGTKTRKQFKVHRLVATMFIENPGNKETVNHKDGNKLNNSVSNLEWMTSGENLKHAHETGLINIFGTKNGSAKLTPSMVQDMRLQWSSQGVTLSQLARDYGVDRATVSDAVKYQTWKHV